MKTDVVVIGAGPAGLFSVFQAGMLGMSCQVVDALECIGGQCAALYPEKPIYDIPAYSKILAADLVEQLKQQAGPFRPTYHLGQQVVKLSNRQDNFQITTSKNLAIEAKVIIIAAGPGAFGPNRPMLEGIENFEGISVFYHVTNQQAFANKNVVIAGGGDSAIDWALSLAVIAKKVYLVHRRAKFRALPESLRQLQLLVDEGRVELIINYQLAALIGQNGQLDEVVIKDLAGHSQNLPADILLPCFGLSQALGPIADWGLTVKSHNIAAAPPYFETNIPGIYAVGDVVSYPGKLKLILTGFAEAASSLHHAYNRVFNGQALHFEYSTSKRKSS